MVQARGLLHRGSLGLHHHAPLPPQLGSDLARLASGRKQMMMMMMLCPQGQVLGREARCRELLQAQAAPGGARQQAHHRQLALRPRL